MCLVEGFCALICLGFVCSNIKDCLFVDLFAYVIGLILCLLFLVSLSVYVHLIVCLSSRPFN